MPYTPTNTPTNTRYPRRTWRIHALRIEPDGLLHPMPEEGDRGTLPGNRKPPASMAEGLVFRQVVERIPHVAP